MRGARAGRRGGLALATRALGEVLLRTQDREKLVKPLAATTALAAMLLELEPNWPEKKRVRKATRLFLGLVEPEASVLG